MVFEQVLSNLEAEGYEVWPLIIPAVGINAPHRRDRLWIVAYNDRFDRHGRPGQVGCETPEGDKIVAEDRNAADAKSTKCEQPGNTWTGWEGLTNDYSSPADADRIDGNAGGYGTGPVSKQQKAEIFGMPSPDSDGEREQQSQGPEQEFGGRPGDGFKNIAYSDNTGWSQYRFGITMQAKYASAQRDMWSEEWPEVAARLCRMADGVPGRVDRLKALGNAIVPQVAFQLFMAIRSTYEIQTSL